MTLLDRFKQVKLFVLDVDGVMTDGSILIVEDGNYIRKMNVKDGYALQLGIKQGYGILVVSGSDAPSVVTRMNKLGISDVVIKVTDKLKCVKEYLSAHDYEKEQILFMGDDLPDLELMQFVGLGCCPADAAPELKAVAQYISPFKGGEGCVRDVFEKVLRLNLHWHHLSEVASR